MHSFFFLNIWNLFPAGILHTIVFHRALVLVRPKDVDCVLFEITYVSDSPPWCCLTCMDPTFVLGVYKAFFFFYCDNLVNLSKEMVIDLWTNYCISFHCLDNFRECVNFLLVCFLCGFVGLLMLDKGYLTGRCSLYFLIWQITSLSCFLFSPYVNTNTFLSSFQIF